VAPSVEERLRTLLIKDLPLPEPLLVDSSATVGAAIELMRSRRRPCVLVCEDRRCSGIFTERDVLLRVDLGRSGLSAPITTVMTPSPRCLRLEDRVAEAIGMMTREGYRHIPLVDRDGLGVGLLSARDVLVYIAEHFPAEVLNLPPQLDQLARRTDGG
jgi:CBS domain-containing protein